MSKIKPKKINMNTLSSIYNSIDNITTKIAEYQESKVLIATQTSAQISDMMTQINTKYTISILSDIPIPLNNIIGIPFTNMVGEWIISNWDRFDLAKQNQIKSTRFIIKQSIRTFEGKSTFIINDMITFLGRIQYLLKNKTIRINHYRNLIKTWTPSDCHSIEYYKSVLDELITMHLPFCYIYKTISTFWRKFQSILNHGNLENDTPIEVNDGQYNLLL